MSTITDPIADFLTRVRNGARAQRLEVLIPYSKIKADIARISERGRLHLGLLRRHKRSAPANQGRSISSWTDPAQLQDSGASVAPGCAVMLAQMKSRECLVEWVWRSFPLHEGSCRGAKQESKRSAANCWPTFGDDLHS